ncbi:hypothetical protein OV207_05900 [Corallococcus sp. BB11-1]|uniref:ABC-three component system protein n=1 Tax=Corallococcus sp. BB11-1 TaxID=2996783 RepID=UPI00226F061C|nr:ABC-three component system protein [Corallococcus sp. BB11-1]MCY1030981.1 hypothetical protein [Corallococcus sp. BB11-1]
MNSPTEVRQEGNQVTGHQAGRDVNVSTTIYQQPQQGSLMRTLIARYKSEVENNPDFRQIIEELQHYLTSADEDGVKVVGLEVKLKTAGRQDDVRRAARLKEIFFKKLERHYFSETAQHIYAYILGRLFQLFNIEVRPLLYAQVERFAIDRIVHERVLQPVFTELEDNVLLIKHDELSGMLYFLTGNCHIRWTESC